MSVHEATGMTPFKTIFGIEAFDFDTEIGWKTFWMDKTKTSPLQTA
jgi:hypothetical protein